MKINFLSLIFFSGIFFDADAQNDRTDSLKQLLGKTPRDTNHVKLLTKVAGTYYFSNPDSSLAYSKKALAMARDLHFTRIIPQTLNNAGESLQLLGDYPASLKMQFEALEINRHIKDLAGEATSLGFIGFTFVEFGEYRQSLQYLMQANNINEQLSRKLLGALSLSITGNAYYLLNKQDSALYYQKQAFEKLKGLKHRNVPPTKSMILTGLGNIYAITGKKDSALQFYHEALLNSTLSNDRINISTIQKKIADVFYSTQLYDSSLYYAKQGYVSGRNIAQKLKILEASLLLVKLYQNRKRDSAFFYQDIAIAMKDSLYGPQKFKQLQLLMLEEQERQQNITREREQFNNRIKFTALISALVVFGILAFILIRNNRQKQKANNLLKEQKNKIENTLLELKSTQSQLVQREKMASLGELTAGIAHEIQNPLNFVNNFSEVNRELLVEMKDEIDKGNLQEVKSIAKDVIDNEEKINHHGKRADAIVKGMLQHSRSSSGVKEPTDINALCDEYLRLSYHGLRAKDKSFNANFKTDFDESIEKINIIPQDIGRVILNLLTNAFYAVNEKKKQQPEGYEPTVSVSTKKVSDKVEVKVEDNGNGIPQKVLDKIFQPFFTTKPTGQGTGLGLSLSYDIIKAHGGELKVETKVGEGAEFIIHLPVKENL